MCIRDSYILVFIAAITSAISLVEVVTTFYMDKAHAKGQPGNRKKYTILTLSLIHILRPEGQRRLRLRHELRCAR